MKIFRMHKKKIVKEDGRYLVYYWFEEKDKGRKAKAKGKKRKGKEGK